MRPLKLQSCLAKPIENFINLRRLPGTDYQSQAQLSGYFDRFLLEQKWNKPRITPLRLWTVTNRASLTSPHAPV